ncbi:hypothetical protein INR49_000926, partial [Caranx melampygus]
SEVTDKLRFSTFYLYFSLVLCELILCCFNEKPPLFSSVVTDPNPCPETTAGFLSTMTFWWFTRWVCASLKLLPATQTHTLLYIWRFSLAIQSLQYKVSLWFLFFPQVHVLKCAQ